eukprot:TRINITY_DN28563_c0_g1_i1.p2 TRINITY_DN28563_c0_g1~~TRINITY_DN28563_c0_g1_i1.p2  ORF type:complete len:122 (-),score=4.57 TRINITY_DN28563_c0_g1_i1:113-478(-)
MHMRDQIRPRLRIQPHRRLIQQQDLGPVHQSTGNFQPPPMPAVEIAHPLRTAFDHRQSVQRLRGGQFGGASGDPVQTREIQHVAPDRQIQVERRLLKHHAHARQGLERRVAHVISRDLDPA